MFTFCKTTLDEAPCLEKWFAAPQVHRWVPIDDWRAYFKAVTKLKNYYLYSVYREGKLIAFIAAEITDTTAAVCLVVDPARHGTGLGTAILREIQQKTEALFGDISSYIAGIFS